MNLLYTIMILLWLQGIFANLIRSKVTENFISKKNTQWRKSGISFMLLGPF